MYKVTMRKISIPLIVLLGGILVIAGLSAQPLRPLERHARPESDGAATLLNVSVYVIDILNEDIVDGTMTIDYFIMQSWNDSRLSTENLPNGVSRLDLTLADIWNPEIMPVNVTESSLQSASLNIDETGTVYYRKRAIESFTTPFNLKKFPFDKQTVRMTFLSALYGDEQLDIQFNSDRTGYLGNFSLPGWEFNSMEHAVKTKSIGEMEDVISGFEISFSLERESGFYLWKVVVPLGFIVFMAWTVFWIDPAQFGGQVAISTSSVITLIAFQLSLHELLPRISYLTKIDSYALSCSFLVFMAMGESILTARLASLKKHELALRIDRWMRAVYPVLYGLLLLKFFF